MIRFRSSLLLLAITGLLLSAAPVAAGGDEVLPSQLAAPAANPTLDAQQCTDPGQAPAVVTGSYEQAIPASDFILCSCKFCKNHPDVICRISPTGFSILCSDYYNTRC